MAITHSLVAADWTVDAQTGNIRYIGHDHNGASPSYATVIELHRWLQGLADDQSPLDTSDEMYIAMLNPSVRSTDNIITLINGYNIDEEAAEHLYDGSIIQDDGDTIYDGIVNFGNADVQIQILQDGAIIADDYWNYNLGGTASAGSATTLTDTGAFAGLDLVGMTVVNTSGGARDGSKGRIASHTDDVLTFDSGEMHGGASADGWSASDTYLIGYPINPNAEQGISHRFMVKVRSDGCDVDGRRLVGTCRRMGNTYGEFKINGTSRGNNVLALTDAEDLNCTTALDTVIGSTWDTDFSGEDAGFEQIDVDDDGSTEDYYGKYTWINTHTINDLYEYVKGQTEDGSGYTVHGLSGEVLRGITHSFGYDGEAGGISISDYDMLAWGTLVDHGTVTGGPFTVGEVVLETGSGAWKGRVLAVDTVNEALVVDITSGTVGAAEAFEGQSSGATATTSGAPSAVTGGGVLHVLAHDPDNDRLYVQVLKGTMAADNGVLYYAGTTLGGADVTDYCLVAIGVMAITARTISTPIIGVSTGTAIIGSYGFGIDDAKLQAADKVFDLTNTQYSPPTTVTNTVSGIVSGEDYVFVAPWDGSTYDANEDPAIDTDQMLVSGPISGGSVGSITVNNIPGSTPDSGTIRVVNDEGFHIRLPYDSYDDGTDTFTLSSTYDFSGSGLNDSVADQNHAYVTYLDKLADATSLDFQMVYDEDIDLLVLVRDGGVGVGNTPIKQFISEWSITNTSKTLSAIRTSDT